MANELIAEAITDYLGERCLDYAEGCPTCEAWAEYDVLTRPAAPVEGLDTWKFHAPHNGSAKMIQNTDGDYVTRSQAEAIIAAKDDAIKTLQADNAALTARVKGLDGLIDGENCADPDKIDALFRRAETAETQLAATRKALEFYADVHKYPAPFTGGMGDLWSDCGAIARAALEAKP